MKGRSFLIDLINALLAIGILVMVILNSVGSYSGMLFFHIFVFGALLSALNCIKKIREGSGFAVAFGFFTLLMGAVSVLCYLKL